MFLQQLVALQVVHMFQQLVLLGAASQQHVSNIYSSWRSRRRLTTLSLRGTHIHTHFGRRAPRERTVAAEAVQCPLAQAAVSFGVGGYVAGMGWARVEAGDGSTESQPSNFVVNR